MNTKTEANLAEIFLVLVLIISYTLAASLVSLNRYWQYNAFWYDFGIFDETIWKLSKFQLPIITQLAPPIGKIIWSDHFNPSSIFFAPLYWITDRQEIILIVQAVIAGFSACIAYLIVLKEVKSRIVRISLIASYLGFVGLQNALYTDVHNIVFALFPLMLTIWAIYQKNWRLYWVFLIVTLGFQENLAGAGIGLGLFLILRKRKERNIQTGVLTFLISIAYGILVMKFLIPWFNGGVYKYQPAIPHLWFEWITRFFTPSIKLKTIILTFATFSFLPLGNLSTFPLIVEHYLERFVLNTAGTRWDLGFHYNALLSPIMFLASLEVIRKLQENKKIKKLLPIWGVITIGIVIFLHRFHLHGPLMLATHPVFYQQTKNAKFLADFTVQIPQKGLLMTQNNIAAHFTHRDTVLLNKEFEKIQPDVIVIDIRPGQNPNNFFPLTQMEVEILTASLSANQDYIKKAITDSQFIFIR